jgi:hypothetical protein
MRLTIKLGKARGRQAIGATIAVTNDPTRPCSVREENFIYQAEMAAREGFRDLLCELDNCKFKIVLQTGRVDKKNVKGKLYYQHGRDCPREIYALGMAYFDAIKKQLNKEDYE